MVPERENTPRRATRGAQTSANADDSSGCSTGNQCIASCPACECEQRGRKLASFFHYCGIGAINETTWAQDFRALVDLGGKAFDRALRPHERADFKLANPGLNLICAYVEVEPTADFGIERTYYHLVRDGDPDFAAVETLSGSETVSGADARKWVSA